MTDLVPEPNPSQQRARERGCSRKQKLFLSYGGRPSYATPPGPRALCEVGLAAWFLFFALHFSPGHTGSAPAPHSRLQRARGGECGRGQKYFCLTAAARAAPRPQDHTRCERWGLRARCFSYCKGGKRRGAVVGWYAR